MPSGLPSWHVISSLFFFTFRRPPWIRYCPSSHKEGEVSEGARKDFRPGHKTTLKFNAAHSGGCGQTTDLESESERTGSSSVRVLRSRSVPASDALPTSSRATVSRHCHLTIRTITIRQQVFDCNYLSCRICFNVLNSVFILFIFNLYCLVNIHQHCRNSSHCD